MADPAALHNELAGEIVKAIVKPVVEAGGTNADIMVLTESVLLGVCLYCVRLGGDEKVIDLMVERVKGRLAEIRLGDIETKGRG